ncbi:MAG: AMP-dependent synthetase/ligase [Christensenellales bacterium]
MRKQTIVPPPPRNLLEVFLTNGAKYKDSTALIYKPGHRYERLTYFELRHEISKTAFMLKEIGIRSKDYVLILSENRPEWVIVDIALMLVGAISVPIHKDSSKSHMQCIVNETKPIAIFFSSEPLLRLLPRGSTSGILHYIAFEDNLDSSTIKSFQKLLNKYHVDRAQTIGMWKDALSIQPQEIVTVVYSSGTTGKPKGAQLTHQNILFMILNNPMTKYGIAKKHSLFSLLPLSHVYGRIADSLLPLYAGGSICYCRDPKNFMNEVRNCRPTMIMGVPILFEKIYDQIMQRMKPHIREKIISAVKGENSISCRLIVSIIKRIIQKRFGGNIEYFICGGAKLNQDVIRFFELCGILLLEGYGLTETAATVAMNEPAHFKIGTAGRILNGNHLCILDGEIIIKGPSVMLGYINPEDMENAFTEDGYFKTGDLGSIDEEGYLTILGRKKDMLVLSTGENIAPIVIEQALLKSPYIDQTLVIGDGYKHVSAIIAVNSEEIGKHFDLGTVNVLVDERIKHLIDAEVLRTTKDLPENQQIRKYIMARQPFTVDNNQLTTSLKPRRQEILSFYAEEIKELYGK